MRIVCTSDFHWRTPPQVPECDLLVLAGDVLYDIDDLERWVRTVPAGEVVAVAGNHDHIAVENGGWHEVRALPWTYLENEAATVAGLRVFGSPMSMPFGAWDFMAPEDKLEAVWATIPDDTELLVVHGPAAGILDKTATGHLTGSRSLRDRLHGLHDLRLLVTGHIHEAYGETQIPLPHRQGGAPRWLRCVNGSLVDERYQPTNPPVVVDLEDA